MVSAISSTTQDCATCHKPPVPPNVLKTCGKCQQVYYCCAKCQRDDWPSHKLSCKPAMALNKPQIQEIKVQGAHESSPEPTVTGYLRCLRAFLDAEKEGLGGNGQEILVFGPGCLRLGDYAHCPQMAEALRYWKRCRFTVLDSNPEVLECIDKMNQKVAHQYLLRTFVLNSPHMQPSKELKAVQTKLEAEKIGNNQVLLKKFRMGSDDVSSLPQANVILATFSLQYPIRELFDREPDPVRRIDFFAQYLSKLKPGGTFYVEEDCVFLLTANMQDLQEDPIGIASPEKIQGVLKYIHETSGLKYECRKLSTAIQKEVSGRFCVEQPKGHGDAQKCLIVTSNLYAFTRSNN